MLKLDISRFTNYRLRRYELDRYPIEAAIATEKELLTIAGDTGNGRRSLPKDTLAARYWTQYREPHFHFDPAVHDVIPPVHLIGYWQSERYFQHISDIIRRELTPIESPDSKNERALEKILGSTSVAVHVRRGDYVDNPVTAAYHGVPSVKYYTSAMDYIASRVSNAIFYVFSDDLHWASQNLGQLAPVELMTADGPDCGFRDIQLMSACKHHILANSSFSWWGAWLNTSSNKIVIAPTPWFLNNALDTRDLLPRGWIRMPAHNESLG
jgi:hypothetical protein